MGWTGVFHCRNAKERYDELMREFTWENDRNKYECLERKGKWYKIIRTDKATGIVENNIAVVLLKRHGDEICTKEMDVSCHPFVYDCPLAWVKEFVPFNDNSAEWKANALKFHEKKHKVVKELEIGKVYHVCNKWLRVEYRMSTKQWVGYDISNGRKYRFTKAKIDFSKEYQENKI